MFPWRRYCCNGWNMMLNKIRAAEPTLMWLKGDFKARETLEMREDFS
jgi:hypothetical protein